MKKTIFIACVIAIALMFTMGCASKQPVTPEPTTAPIANQNGTSISSMQTVIIDWQDRTIGAPVNPSWLKSLVKGNANQFLIENGIADEYANHKWFTYGVQNASLATAENIARGEILAAIAEEMSTAINSSNQVISQEQKEAVRQICASTRATITGVGFRNSYWQKEQTTDAYGNMVQVYNYYAFYSCPLSTYNELLNTYMIELLQNKGLDEHVKQSIAQQAQQILDDANVQSEKVEAQREREFKERLAYEQTKQAAERTKQVESGNQAEASIAQSKADATIAGVSTGSMSPALASLISSF